MRFLKDHSVEYTSRILYELHMKACSAGKWRKKNPLKPRDWTALVSRIKHLYCFEDMGPLFEAAKALGSHSDNDEFVQHRETNMRFIKEVLEKDDLAEAPDFTIDSIQNFYDVAI